VKSDVLTTKILSCMPFRDYVLNCEKCDLTRPNS